MAEDVAVTPTRLLAELDAAAGAPVVDGQLEAVRVALTVEDVAGIVLHENQIDLSVLGDPAALTALLTAKDA